MKRRALRALLLAALAGAVAAIVAAWVLEPRLAKKTVDGILAARPPGLRASHGRVVRAGLGIDLRDVAITGERESETVFRADSVRVIPSFDWPPVAIELDGLRLSSAGAAAFARAAATVPGWAEESRSFTRRQYGNLHGARIALHVRDAHIDLGGRELVLARARGALIFQDPTRIRAVLARDDGNAGTAAGVESAQDGATIRLEALAPGADGVPQLWQWRARVPAERWRGFTDDDPR